MSDQITLFRIAIADDQLEDLKRRLRAARWPDRECVDDWTQGLPLAYAQEVALYWLEKYDWRAREALLNRFPQFKTQIDGLGIHFVHVRSPHPDATPLLVTHGWPGSIAEFQKVIEPLTNPTAHGGEPADAFHIVCPSLPGYGFSDKPTRTGWNPGVGRSNRSHGGVTLSREPRHRARSIQAAGDTKDGRKPSDAMIKRRSREGPVR